jgi:hypothetical protein
MVDDSIQKHRGINVVVRVWENFGRLPLWRQVLLGLVALAMAGVIGLVLAAKITRIQLGSEIVKISRAGESVAFTDIQTGPVQTEVGLDANSFYFDAIRVIPPGDLISLKQVNLFYRVSLASLPTSQFPADMHEKVAQALAKAEPILSNLDKGSVLALSGFNIGIMQGNQVCRGRLDSVQGAVSLLSLRTLNLIQANDCERAAESVMSELKFLRVFDTYPTMLVQERKMACCVLVCSDIQVLLTRCQISEERLKNIQFALQGIITSDSLTRMFLAERAYQIEIARNLIPRGIASRYLASDVPQLPERLAMPPFTWHRMRFFALSAGYMRDMARLIAVSRKPWPGPLDDATIMLAKSSVKPGKLTSISVLLTRLTAETLATVQCTTTAVAIELYRRDQGRIPGSLDDICPRYIKTIPIDPFTGKPLLYVHDDPSYTVYSAGINRTDDGGAVAPKAEQTGILDVGIRIKPVATQ